MKIIPPQPPQPIIPAFVFQPRKPIRYKPRPAPTPPPAPPPVVPLNVLSVTRISGTSVRVLFDGDPHVATGLAGAEFYVNGSGFQFVADSPPDGAELSYEFQNVNVGDPWELTAQPAWAGVPVVAPVSGLVE